MEAPDWGRERIFDDPPLLLRKPGIMDDFGSRNEYFESLISVPKAHETFTSNYTFLSIPSFLN